MESVENPAIPSETSQRIVFTGQIFFAVGLIGIGAQHFIFSNLIPVIVPWWPDGVPGRSVVAYLVGAILVSCGGCVLLNQKARPASTSVGFLFLAFFVLMQVPLNAVRNLLHIGGWTVAIKEFALFGCSFVVAGAMPPEGNGDSRGGSSFRVLEDGFVRFAPYPLAILVSVFGIDHFIYTKYIATLVPSWIPSPVFWTCFAGGALLAAGIGIIFNIAGRLAGTMLGIMLFIWVVILHIPRALADPSGQLGNEWTSVFEALAFSGIAFIIGQTLPKRRRMK